MKINKIFCKNYKKHDSFNKNMPKTQKHAKSIRNMKTHGNVPKCIPEQDNGTETVDC